MLSLRGVLVGLTDPCMLANTGLPKTLNFIAIPCVHYSGVIGIGVVSVGDGAGAARLAPNPLQPRRSGVL